VVEGTSRKLVKRRTDHQSGEKETYKILGIRQEKRAVHMTSLLGRNKGIKRLEEKERRVS